MWDAHKGLELWANFVDYKEWSTNKRRFPSYLILFINALEVDIQEFRPEFVRGSNSNANLDCTYVEVTAEFAKQLLNILPFLVTKSIERSVFLVVKKELPCATVSLVQFMTIIMQLLFHPFRHLWSKIQYAELL